MTSQRTDAPTREAEEPARDADVPARVADVRARLAGLMTRDRVRLAKRVDRAAGLRDARARGRALGQVMAEVGAAADRVEARRRLVPAISYPQGLPVSQRRDEIAAAIRDHQVVIVAGETGSGKTTQIPKICLELGRGVTGQIGHTQPRRIAARTVAERIAAELGTEVGAAVGYKVRFTDNASDNTLVKIMTDGILLTEMQRDRQLLRYDTLIIDEAHERSLNIDFILGYLKRLLPSRPDLKVIITSATIDPERFSKHFAPEGVSARPVVGGGNGGRVPEGAGGAPIIEVSGRTYPVEVRYRPLADPDQPEDEPKDQVEGICEAVAELTAEGPGDILVFLSGEREIRDTADALSGETGLEVLPLYARLSTAEQHRVFQQHTGRRVVLATNVAETSLTVPGIKYVIDPGTARISRYSRRTKVQRLPIERISQASARQRAGRCGRTSDGICIRLYTEDDFESRPEFTDPEILRTSLASVILRMAALDLGDVAQFPFADPPDSRSVTDGVRLLEELGAITRGQGESGVRLTGIGRKLAQLPVDPRLARMILAAEDNGCVDEMLIITSVLSIQDPREHPSDQREAAATLHARFSEPHTDFLAYLNLWDYLRERQADLSGSAFRRLCRREFLHYLRVREWQDLYGQLRRAARDLGLATEPGRDPSVTQASAAQLSEGGPRFTPDLSNRVHMSLLAGLLSHVGMRDAPAKDGKPTDGKSRGRRPLAEFSGARGARFAIAPDSVLARKPPQWVIAAELVETSRLWARTVARIEPEWVEPLAAHLVVRTYSDPHWDARRGAAMARERVTLYGLPVITNRPVSYGRVDPAAARDLFIQHALVEGDWTTRHQFFHDNQATIANAGEMERRARRPGVTVDDSIVFGFYDQRIPPEVTSTRHFDTWWKRARHDDPGLLTIAPSDLAGPDADGVSAGDYPDAWGDLPLAYEFAPGEAADGVTATIPLAALHQVDDGELGWQVPGLREELVTELIRSLPKQLRKSFVPAPETARAVLPRLGTPEGDLLEALGAELWRMSGVRVPYDAWDLSRLPDHLRMTFRVVDGDTALAVGKDLGALRKELRPRLEAMLAEAAKGITRTGLRAWTIGTLPEVFSDGRVQAYPALADTGSAVDVRLFPSRAQAQAAMVRGTRRLILLQVPSGGRGVASRLLALSRGPYPSAGALVDDCAACAADQLIANAGGPSWDAEGFARLLDTARLELAAGTAAVLSTAAKVMAAAVEAEAWTSGEPNAALMPAYRDARAQLAALVYPGFISETGARRLPDLERYLRGIAYRLGKLPESPSRDAARMAVVHRVGDAYADALGALSEGARAGEQAQAVRWMIEELRVSLFAQSLGTPVPVSEQRIEALLRRLAS